MKKKTTDFKEQYGTTLNWLIKIQVLPKLGLAFASVSDPDPDTVFYEKKDLPVVDEKNQNCFSKKCYRNIGIFLPP